jgi:hypothetical protein
MPVATPARSWLRQIADVLNLRASPLGVVFFVSMLAAFALWELSLGRLAEARSPSDPPGPIHDMRIAVIHMACVAYLMAAFVYALRAGDQTLARVRPLLGAGPESRAAWDPSREDAALRVAAVAGAIAWLVATLASPGTVHLDPRGWSPETVWHRVLGLAIGVLGFRLSAILTIQSIRLSRLAASMNEVDLLDPSSLAPFARQGLNNVLLLAGFAAAFSLFLIEPGFLPLAVPLWVLTAGVAAVGLLLPLLGARRQIQRAKQAELAWCRERLRAARRSIGEGASSASRLDELTAWERRIAEVREWPLDTTALARFGFYLLIPLGSWSGGALVERMIDALLR